MTMIFTPLLKPGDTIGIMSPSSYIDEIDVEEGKALLEARGYKVLVHPQTLACHNQSAGTNTDKANAFHDLLLNDDVAAILFSSGGNRALHWVNDIDMQAVKEHPKPLVGFSDATALLNVLHAQTGLVTYHGPSLRWLAKYKDNAVDADHLFALLSGQLKTIDLDGADILKGGSATGKLIGGNASVFQYLLNDNLPLDGAILFLEDWNIETSRLDLLFCALKRAGVFNRIGALILGTFDNLQDTGRPYGFTLDAILAEHLGGVDIPVIKNAPFGHGARLKALPIGAVATLSGQTLTF